MAVKFWVPVASATVRGTGVDPSPLNKQVAPPGVVDETDRVIIEPAPGLWRLVGTSGTVTADHGGITSVKLHARIYMSNNGTFSWDFSTNNAFVAPYVAPSGTKTYSLPDWLGSVYCGHSYDNGHNFNIPGNPVSKQITWDVTALASWTNGILSSMEFGLSMDQEEVSTNHLAGLLPINGYAGNTPRYNVSQLILEVDAADPEPPPPTYGSSLMAVFA